MVVRTTQRLLVEESQLAEALRLFADALAGMGLVADIEVTEDHDPEDSAPADRNVLVARVSREVDLDRLVEAIPVVADRLREAKLLYPAVALDFHVLPGW